MTRYAIDVKATFGDSREIVEALQGWADSDGVPIALRYWLLESAVHIDGLYEDACALQREVRRLESKVVALKAAHKRPRGA